VNGLKFRGKLTFSFSKDFFGKFIINIKTRTTDHGKKRNFDYNFQLSSPKTKQLPFNNKLEIEKSR
jgi:hypothetical protein